MTNESGALTNLVENAPPVARAEALKTTRPFYWSVRRELWEYPAIWMAPSITAGIVFFFFVLVMVVMARPGRVPELPYVIVTSFMLAAMAVVWVFYCLDALHGERRDRSILFWKSLPVSDLTTVLSKAAISLVVMPFVTFVVTAALQLALWFAHKATGLTKLCLAGGVALNCVANGRIVREGPFRDIWIQPAAGDAGGALGAALAVWHQYHQQPRKPFEGDMMRGSYLGPEFSDDLIRDFLDSINARYQRLEDEALVARRVGLAVK